MSWETRRSERLQWELEQLRASGGSFFEIQGAGDRGDEIRTSIEYDGADVGVSIVFPPDFPDAPPAFYADRVILDRHQDLRSKNFCLLADPSSDWEPSRAAVELMELLRRLVADSAAGTEAVMAGEAEMPEPVTAYYAYHRSQVALVGSALFESPRTTVATGMLDVKTSRDERLLFVVGGDGFPAASMPESLLRDAVPATGPVAWVAADRPPDPAAPDDEIVALVQSAAPAFVRAMKVRAKRGGRNVPVTRLVGITFMEEGPRRGEARRVWLFVALVASPKGSISIAYLVEAQAVSRDERARRTPELACLDRARVVVIGAGSIGGAVAVELAKAGTGQIDIVDPDRYDINNAVRHVLPVRCAGQWKAGAVASLCDALNPFGAHIGHRIFVGGDAEHGAALDKLIANADLVIETTGAQHVSRVVQRRCRAAGRTLVVAALTAGNYGGEVLVTGPNGACFDCFVAAQRDGLVPSPQVGPRSSSTPVGCRHPAFTGAGFDAAQIATEATRAAVRALGMSGYPPLDHDWIVMNFRAKPRLLDGPLGIHPDCPNHFA